MISFKQGLIIHPVESHHPAVSETGDHMTEKDNSKDMEHTRQIVRSEENTSARKSSLAFDELRKTVARLRAADGCPWDRAQTHESLKPACVEEAAEVVCGINILRETGKPDSLVEELGDLLLQVIMHAQIGEEEGLFSCSLQQGRKDKQISGLSRTDTPPKDDLVVFRPFSPNGAVERTPFYESCERIARCNSDIRTLPAHDFSQ